MRRATKSWHPISNLLGAILGICATAVLFSPGARAATERTQDLVDLHAHFFMPEASGFPFFGGFDEPLKARDWSDRLKTKVNARTLEDSHVRIAIVALYAHPLFFHRERESIRIQIAAARKFVKDHPDWILATDPRQAREALDQGKRVMILSIEGASGILETEDDIHEFVDKLGVRIVTPLHFIDDEFGGAAFMPGIEILVNPFAAVDSLLYPHYDSTGVRINDHGLTPKGKQLIRSLIRHGVWIDLSHASDASVRDIISILKEQDLPPLYTHTILRSFMRGERGISVEALKEVADHRGIVGLLPSDDMLRGTKVNPKYCPAVCNGQCHGGIAAYATQFAEMSKTLHFDRILVGTDIDAPLNFLQPSCKEAAEQTPQGFWKYNQLSKIQHFLEKKGLLPAKTEKPETEIFLTEWERAVGEHLPR